MKLEHQVQGKLSSMNCPLAKLSSMNCHLAKLSSRNCLCIPFPWNIQRRPGLGLKLSYFFRLWTLVVFIGTSTSLNSMCEIGQTCLFCWVLQRFFTLIWPLKNFRTNLTSLEENLMRLTSLNRKLPIKLPTRMIGMIVSSYLQENIHNPGKGKYRESDQVFF